MPSVVRFDNGDGQLFFRVVGTEVYAPPRVSTLRNYVAVPNDTEIVGVGHIST